MWNQTKRVTSVSGLTESSYSGLSNLALWKGKLRVYLSSAVAYWELEHNPLSDMGHDLSPIENDWMELKRQPTNLTYFHRLCRRNGPKWQQTIVRRLRKETQNILPKSYLFMAMLPSSNDMYVIPFTYFEERKKEKMKAKMCMENTVTTLRRRIIRHLRLAKKT